MVGAVGEIFGKKPREVLIIHLDLGDGKERAWALPLVFVLLIYLHGKHTGGVHWMLTRATRAGPRKALSHFYISV